MKNEVKEILIKLSNRKVIITTSLIFIVCGAFYWYQIRPAKIYSKCGEYSKETYPYSLERVEARYKYCVRKNGINK